MPQICATIDDNENAIIRRWAQERGLSVAKLAGQLMAQAVRYEGADLEELKRTLAVQANTIEQLEDQLGFLRGEYSRINQALAQRQLTSGGFWARLLHRGDKG
jgi:hypothetical protein